MEFPKAKFYTTRKDDIGNEEESERGKVHHKLESEMYVKKCYMNMLKADYFHYWLSNINN